MFCYVPDQNSMSTKKKKKKREWVLWFFTCDKIFEIRIKNLTILQYKINRPSYMLIKKKILVLFIQPTG
jgi:hypothetical protein